MRSRFLVAVAAVALAFALAACASLPASQTSRANQSDADARFQQHSTNLLEEMWREFPEFGVQVGNYRYADQLTVPDQAQRDRSLAFYDRQLAQLATFDAATLSATNKVDLALMRNQFESRRWYLTTFKGWQWQPSSYNEIGRAHV